MSANHINGAMDYHYFLCSTYDDRFNFESNIHDLYTNFSFYDVVHFSRIYAGNMIESKRIYYFVWNCSVTNNYRFYVECIL